MVVDCVSPLAVKRRRFKNVDPMEAESAKAKLAAVKERIGRDIRVFDTTALSSSPTIVSNDDETDDLYEFTAEDYYRLLATKKQDKFLKTSKIREAEKAEQRSRFTKAVIRVRFPDNCTLEATFHPSESIQSLIDLLKKVIARPELPFYIYITPPKKLIKDMSQDFFSAGFVPGAIVYFSYDIPKGDDTISADEVPFLQEEIVALKDIEHMTQQTEHVHSDPANVKVEPSAVAPEPKHPEKKPVKPKWFKM